MAETNYAGECWQTIPFAPDYQVSSLGRVRRSATEPANRHMRLLKHAVGRGGYPRVALYVRGVVRHITVHQIVCRVFHGDRPRGKDEVGHIDGDRANPSATNLRWVTKAENYADRNGHGTHNQGERNGAAKLSEAHVEAVFILSERMASRKVAQVLGISKSQVGNILRGEAWCDNPKRRAAREQRAAKQPVEE